MSKPMANAAIKDDRQSQRSEVRLPARVTAGPGRSFDTIVLNVSAHGVMIECPITLVPGRPVTIATTALPPTPGRIAWARDGHLGIAFDAALSLNAFEAMTAVI